MERWWIRPTTSSRTNWSRPSRIPMERDGGTTRRGVCLARRLGMNAYFSSPLIFCIPTLLSSACRVGSMPYSRNTTTDNTPVPPTTSRKLHRQGRARFLPSPAFPTRSAFGLYRSGQLQDYPPDLVQRHLCRDES